MTRAENIRDSIGARQVVATPHGLDWLAQNPSLETLLSQFCATETAPENLFASFPHVGFRDKTIARGYDGVAINISSPSTGMEAHRSARPIKPANLIKDFKFLQLVHDRLNARPEADILAPEQFIAVQSRQGNFLRVEEAMTDWIDLASLVHDKTNRRIGLTPRMSIGSIMVVAQARVATALKDPRLRIGLDLQGTLLNDNILVPRGSDHPETDRLCILVQPTPVRMLGSLSLLAVQAQR